MFKRLAIIALIIAFLGAPALEKNSANAAAVIDLDPPRAASVVFARDASTGGKVIISWRIPADPDLVAFKIYRSTTSGCAGDLIGTVNAETNSYQDSGLANGTVYYYAVASLDNGNNEGLSEQVSSTPSSNTTQALYPEKTLLRFHERSTVYKADADGRTLRAVSSRVFSANNYSFNDVLVIPISWQDSFYYGGADIYRDGTLIKGTGQETVYIIEDAKKRPFSSKAIFEELGYKFSNVNEIPVSDSGLVDAIDSYATGYPISASGIHTNGALIKVGGDNTVYFLQGGQKKAISSVSIFSSHNFDFDDVVNVSVSELNAYFTGSNLKFMDSVLVKGNAAAVYAIDNNSADRIPFRSAVEFIGMGYDFSNVYSISDTELGDYSLASPLPV